MKDQFQIQAMIDKSLEDLENKLFDKHFEICQLNAKVDELKDFENKAMSEICGMCIRDNPRGHFEWALSMMKNGRKVVNEDPDCHLLWSVWLDINEGKFKCRVVGSDTWSYWNPTSCQMLSENWRLAQ